MFQCMCAEGGESPHKYGDILIDYEWVEETHLKIMQQNEIPSKLTYQNAYILLFVREISGFIK